MLDKFLSYEILPQFVVASSSCRVVALGRGNINDTYLVEQPDASFVLQRINNSVFPEPRVVIENFQKITTHFIKKSKAAGYNLQVPIPVYTLNGDLFYTDSTGGFWRGQTYVPHKNYSVISGGAQAGQVGSALGCFHLILHDLKMRDLRDPLPGFHNLPLYLEDFHEASGIAKGGAGAETHYCLETIERYREEANTLESPIRGGTLKEQPIHGDPKLDNFIFNDEGKVLGLLDLDTVGAGLVHYDIGDCLRSCCNRVGENAEMGKLVDFDLDLCQSLLAGYFSVSGELLSKVQRSFIFHGLLLISFELGLRFFTDHLRGNNYFKVAKEGDNLKRAAHQFRLTDDIAEKEQAIQSMTL